jgi:3D (Asp-Asp-Asp) domain-containing protein
MKKTKLAVAGLAISFSLLSVTAVATAKASLGQMYPAETQQQANIFKAEEDMFVMDTKFRVNWASEATKPAIEVKKPASEVTKPKITKPIEQTIVQTIPQEIKKSPQIKKESPKLKRLSLKASTKSENNQKKVKSTKKAIKQLAPKETTNSRKTAAASKIHSLEVSSGNNIKYSRLIPVKATAYTAAAEENGIWGAYDYFGNPLKLGTIAVDPDVIPMGSTVYITGYTFDGLPSKGMIAKATDMGSAVQGKRVDIFVPASRADASKFGMQDVKVYILE